LKTATEKKKKITTTVCHHCFG